MALLRSAVWGNNLLVSVSFCTCKQSLSFQSIPRSVCFNKTVTLYCTFCWRRTAQQPGANTRCVLRFAYGDWRSRTVDVLYYDVVIMTKKQNMMWHVWHYSSFKLETYKELDCIDIFLYFLNPLKESCLHYRANNIHSVGVILSSL